MGLVTGRGNTPIYKRRCKYCKSELEQREIKADKPNGGLGPAQVIRKSAPAFLCPRCDGPSPPIKQGDGPGGDDE